MDDKQFLIIFRIDGVPFTMRMLNPRKEWARIHALRIIGARNSNIPEERTELVQVYEIGKDISLDQAAQMEAKNKLDKEISGLPAPEDIDPDAFNRILHEAIK